MQKKNNEERRCRTKELQVCPIRKTDVTILKMLRPDPSICISIWRSPLLLRVEAGLWHFQIVQRTNCDLENQGTWNLTQTAPKSEEDVSCKQIHCSTDTARNSPATKATKFFSRIGQTISKGDDVMMPAKQIGIPIWWKCIPSTLQLKRLVATRFDTNPFLCILPSQTSMHSVLTQYANWRDMNCTEVWSRQIERTCFNQFRHVQAKHLGQVITDCSHWLSNMNSTCANTGNWGGTLTGPSGEWRQANRLSLQRQLLHGRVSNF